MFLLPVPESHVFVFQDPRNGPGVGILFSVKVLDVIFLGMVMLTINTRTFDVKTRSFPNVFFSFCKLCVHSTGLPCHLLLQPIFLKVRLACFCTSVCLCVSKLFRSNEGLTPMFSPIDL